MAGGRLYVFAKECESIREVQGEEEEDGSESIGFETSKNWYGEDKVSIWLPKDFLNRCCGS